MRNYSMKSMRVLTRYDAEYTTDETNNLLLKLGHTFALEIARPATRENFLDCIARGDLRALCDFDPDYRELTPADARRVRQISALFSKRADLKLGEDRTANAIRKFKDAEAACRRTNACFRAWSRGAFQYHPDVERVLHDAQQKISRILGDVPSLSKLKLRFGPGATVFRKKKDAHPFLKLGDAFTCSERMVPLAGELLAEMPLWVGLSEAVESVKVDLTVVPGRLEFVPKSWKVDRAIVVEPMLNSMFQLAVGDYMAGLLRQVGVDIRDQSRNQRLARVGSLTGALATLDLSSASDTISTELVAHLLPIDWFSFLSFGRSSKVTLGDDVIALEKFSSMGNGYTFPLETLIFYALAAACCVGEEVKEVSVYGDDIIMPSHRAPLMAKVLTAVGFELNRSKTFWSGGFRESCGKDYLLGVDIRPYYQKGKVTCADLFKMRNFFTRIGDDERARLLERLVAPHVRLYGPDGYGDGHLISDRPLKPHNRESGWGGFIFDTYVDVNRKFLIREGEYVFPLYSVYARHPHGDVKQTRGPTLYLGRLDNAPKGRYPFLYRRLTAVDAEYVVVREDFYAPRRKGEGQFPITLPGTAGYKRISVYTF